MKEVIHTFGSEKNLTGIATIPDNINKKAAVILFNAGVLHKVNAFDMNIDLMKILANDGSLVFRFDLSGMGDSKKSKIKSTLSEQVINDLIQSMDLIEDKYNIKDFVFIGLCTGADNAHKISVTDDRVMGVVWLDGYAYPTTEYNKLNFVRYIKAALNPVKLLRFIRKKFAVILGGNSDYESDEGVDNYFWELPDKEVYRKQMQDIFKRNSKGLYLYSGGVNDYYLYEGQFFDAFKGEAFLSNIEEQYYANADHLYVIKKHRLIMLERIKKWMRDHFLVE